MRFREASRRAVTIVATVVAIAPGAARAADFPGFQADPAHSGHVSGETFVPPLTRAWSRSLGGPVSYPVIANGMVFVTVANRDKGTTLMALDAATGAERWSKPLEHDDGWSAPTYDDGRLFVLAGGWGALYSFDPISGTQNWVRAVSRPGAGPPTASGGTVYVSGFTSWYDKDDESTADGGVYAIRESDGAIRWRRPVLYGDSSSPTLDDRHVYVSYACSQVYALDRATGATAWHVDEGCAGGGGNTSALFDGLLWTRTPSGHEDPRVLDATTGAEVGRFPFSQLPAFADGIGYFARPTGISAVDVKTGRQLWQRPTDPTVTAEIFDTPPLIVAGVVYAGTVGGKLYGLDARTGAVRFMDDTGAGFTGEHPDSFGDPTQSFGAGAGLLVVPNSAGVIAYRGSRKAPGLPRHRSARCHRNRSHAIVCKLRGYPAFRGVARARLTRAGRTFATGKAHRTAQGLTRVALTPRTVVPADRYRLRVRPRGTRPWRAVVTVP
jgi:outer membrane protein assembly factor BamB